MKKEFQRRKIAYAPKLKGLTKHQENDIRLFLLLPHTESNNYLAEQILSRIGYVLIDEFGLADELCIQDFPNIKLKSNIEPD